MSILVVPDVSLEEAFLPDGDSLFAALRDAVAWDARMRSRKTASFGVPYNYSGISYPEAPFPPALAELLVRLDARLGYPSNNCLANYYPDGTSTMGFHSDSAEELAPDTGVAIVSLGAERTLWFRAIADKTKRVEYRLTSGSLLFMTAETQAHWKHAVMEEPGAGGRISLTFRRLRET